MTGPVLVAAQRSVLVFRPGADAGRRVGGGIAGVAPIGQAGGLVMIPEQQLLIVADGSAHRLAVLDLFTSTWSTLFGQGAGDGQLDSPADVTVDVDGRLVIADRGNRRIVRCDVDGDGWESFGAPGTGAGQFVDPTSVAVDDRARVVVADPGARRVVRFDDLDGSGWGVVALPSVGAGMVSYPTGVAAGSDRLLVADAGGRVVHVLDLDDQVVASSSAGVMLLPTYVAADGDDVLVGDPAGNEVRCFQVGPTGFVETRRIRGTDPQLPAPVFEQLGGIASGAGVR